MTWIVIIAVGLGSFLFRVAPLVLLAGRTPPAGPTAYSAMPAAPPSQRSWSSSLRQATTTARQPWP